MHNKSALFQKHYKFIGNEWASIRKTPSKVTEKKENSKEKINDESLDPLLTSDNSSSSLEHYLVRKCEICHRKLLMSSKPSKENCTLLPKGVYAYNL